MAKRVNNKFVFVLALSVCAVGASATGVVLYRKYRSRDPKLKLAQAQAMEKSGDLVTAVEIYQAAADAAHNAHALNTDLVYAKLADLSSTVSAQSKTPEDGYRYYQKSLAALQRALTENPRNREVNEKLMDERYQSAVLDSSAASWAALEELASGLIRNELAPSAKPLTYRAEARLRQAQLLVTGEVAESRLMEIDADLKNAMALDPDAGKPVALKCELQMLRANLAIKHGAADDAQKLADGVEKYQADFLAKHPNDPDVVKIQVQVLLNRRSYAEAIAKIKSAAPLTVSPADSGKDLLAALALTKSAYQAHPGDIDLGELLGELYQMSESPNVAAQPESTEKILQELIAAHPQSAECYFSLGKFYQRRGQLKEAIAQFVKCLENSSTGGGIEARKNSSLQVVSNDAIAWSYMDLCEREGADSDAGRADLNESDKYATKVQNAHINPGMASLLSGRMHFIQGKLPEAAAELHSAEANLTGAPGQSERLLNTWVLLAQTNIRQQQLGAALDYYDKALQAFPGNTFVTLQRADLLIQLARYSDAQIAMESLLKYSASLTPDGLQQAQQILAQAKARLGNVEESQKILSGMDSVDGMLQLAQLNIDQGEYDSALAEVGKVLEKQPDNLAAIQLAMIAYVRLGKTAEASQMVDKALAKDPHNADFQLWHGRLANPNPTGDPVEAQQKLIEGISDVYLKQLQLALLFRQNRNSQKEIAALQAAEAAIGDARSSQGVQRQADIIERIFAATSVAAELSAADADRDKHAAESAAAGPARDKLAEAAAAEGAARDKYWDMARDYAQKAENLNLDGVNGKLYRGRLEAMKSTGKTGIPLIEQAVALRPDYAFGHSILGQAYVSQGRYDAALEEFRQAVHQVPQNISFIRATIELLLKKPDAGRIQEAENLLKQGLMFAPRDPQLAQYADYLGLQSKEDLAKAIQLRETILKTTPGDVQNIRRLSILYVGNRANDPQAVEKAIAIVRPLQAQNPADIDDTSLLADLYARDGKIDDGMKLFDPFITNSDPAIKYQSLLTLGEFCKGWRRFDNAIASFREAIKLQPEGNDDAQRHLGDLYFDMDDMPNAEATYQAILAIIPEGNPRMIVLRRLIESQLRQQKFATADALLEKEILAKQPNDLEGLLLRSFSLIQQNRAKEAIGDLNVVLKNNPGNLDGLYYRALAQYITPGGNLEQAISDLVAVCQQDQTNIKCRELLAQVYQRLARYSEAASAYSEALKLAPDSASVRRDYANFLLDLAEVQQQISPFSTGDLAFGIKSIRPAEVLENLMRESTAKYPEQAEWPMMLARVLALSPATVPQARDIYEAIYKQLPDDPTLANNYMIVLLATKNYEDVIKIATTMIAKRPDVLDFHLRRAAAYAALHKDAEALSDLDQCFTASIEDARRTRNYSAFFAILNTSLAFMPQELVADRLRARLAADPKDTLAAVGLIQTLLLRNRPADALPITAALQVPEDDQALKILVLKERALVNYRAGNYPAAYKDYSAILEQAPSDLDTLNNLAFLLADNMAKPKDALPFAERAVKALEASGNASVLVANVGNVYDTYGWVKFRNGDIDGAVTALRHSLQEQPTPIAYLHLAQVFKQAKRVPEALDAVQSGMDLAAPSKDETLAQFEQMRKDLGGVPKPPVR